MKFLQVASLSLLVETTLSIERTARIRASKNSLNRRKKNAIGTGMDLMGRNRTGTRNGFKSKFNARDKSNFDLGVLQSKGNGGRPKFKANRALHAATEECEETINCEYGVSNGTSCAVACEGECCSGEKACDSFTGRVCKDSVSCQGNYSCAYAYIDYIHQGCDEYMSCYGAGYGYYFSNPIKKVQNGCRGEYACYNAGSYNGNINEIVNSCQGNNACEDAGRGDYYLLYSGSIGTIRDSCVADNACYKAGYEGNITEIMSACNAEEACKNAGSYSMENPFGIDSCCNEVGECESVNETSLPDDCLKSKTVKSGKTGKAGKSSKASVAAREQALHMSLSLREEPSSMSFHFG